MVLELLRRMRHHAAFGRRSWSRRSMTQNLRTNLFSVGVFAQALVESVSLFFPLFISLFNLHCSVCFVIISRVTCNSGSSSAAALYFKVQ